MLACQYVLAWTRRSGYDGDMARHADLRDPAARARLGGEERAKRLTSDRRREIAARAARARWKRTTAAERSELQRRRVLARWEKAKRRA